jgi:hypothetical protein
VGACGRPHLTGLSNFCGNVPRPMRLLQQDFDRKSVVHAFVHLPVMNCIGAPNSIVSSRLLAPSAARDGHPRSACWSIRENDLRGLARSTHGESPAESCATCDRCSAAPPAHSPQRLLRWRRMRVAGRSLPPTMGPPRARTVRRRPLAASRHLRALRRPIGPARATVELSCATASALGHLGQRGT